MSDQFGGSPNEALDDFLDDRENPMDYLAGKGKRFGNLVIDFVAFMVIIFLFSAFTVGNGFDQEDEVSLNLLSYAVYLLMYTLFEAATGKSPGKFITKTSVVKADWSRPTFINCLGRSAARFIPFENIIFLFTKRTLHDSLSDTYVVNDD